MRIIPDPSERLLHAGEVARMFRVDPRTVARWGRDNLIRRVRTPGGSWRYFEADALALLAQFDQQGAGQ
jgi:DNA-binding transcriptional MerR regulator